MPHFHSIYSDILKFVIVVVLLIIAILDTRKLGDDEGRKKVLFIPYS